MNTRNSHRRSFVKKVLFVILQNSQENSFALPATLLNKRLCHRCFPVNFVKFLRTPFSQNTFGRQPLEYVFMYQSNANLHGFNPFDITNRFLHPLKTSEKQIFFGVFKGYRKRPGIKWVNHYISLYSPYSVV